MARGGQGRRTVIGIGERFFFLRGVLFVLFNQYWGIVTFPGFHHERAKEDTRTIENRRRSLFPLQVLDCLLFCFFVCWYKTRKSLLRLPPWARSKTLGSISTRAA